GLGAEQLDDLEQLVVVASGRTTGGVGPVHSGGELLGGAARGEDVHGRAPSWWEGPPAPAAGVAPWGWCCGTSCNDERGPEVMQADGVAPGTPGSSVRVMVGPPRGGASPGCAPRAAAAA